MKDILFEKDIVFRNKDEAEASQTQRKVIDSLEVLEFNYTIERKIHHGLQVSMWNVKVYK